MGGSVRGELRENKAKDKYLTLRSAEALSSILSGECKALFAQCAGGNSRKCSRGIPKVSRRKCRFTPGEEGVQN